MNEDTSLPLLDNPDELLEQGGYELDTEVLIDELTDSLLPQEIRPKDQVATQLAENLNEGIEILVQTYQRDLYSFAYKLLENHDEAEDMVQETFIKAYLALQRYPREKIAKLHVWGWLYAILRNSLLNYLARKRRRMSIEAEIGWLMVNEDEFSPEEFLLREDRREELRRLLGALPEMARYLIYQRYYKYATYEELAAKTGYQTSAVRSLVHRAKDKMREALKSFGKD